VIVTTPQELRWFEGVAFASETVQKARDFIMGGPLAETLAAVGDALAGSAIDHLGQAASSPNPRERLVQAQGDLQSAFFLYAGNLERGFRSLRRVFITSEILQTRGKLIGCASSIALIHWFNGESAANIRLWLDRTHEGLREYEVDAFSHLDRSYFRGDGFKETELGHALDAMATEYYTLEGHILPAGAVRPKPYRFRPQSELPVALQRLAARTGTTLGSRQDRKTFPRWVFPFSE
jgi:hypothetical protein